jgi:hypothetical protein
VVLRDAGVDPAEQLGRVAVDVADLMVVEVIDDSHCRPLPPQPGRELIEQGRGVGVVKDVNAERVDERNQHPEHG